MEAQQEKKMTLAEKMRAKLGGTAPAATPAAVPKTTAAPAAPVVSLVNPPEQKHGVDPDEPKGKKVDSSGAVTSSYGRVEIATMAMQGLVASRVYSPDDSRYPSKVAAEAVQIADALLAALAK